MNKGKVICLLACLQLVGIALFCKGFFPYKVYLSGFANEIADDQLVAPQFDRLVFVLIDALRNDFILGHDSGFQFINQQIERGTAIPFTAKATAPTVTLPRIKALTTGTIPSFLDAILNIAETDTSSSLTHHDNWVYQFRQSQSKQQHHATNRTIHFFGDDTWMRLFPNDIFTKTDGTTSFFVSDTVIVDSNVTRHIETDLKVEDWDAVILHYLGLDHIGHQGGPNSPLMKPKQVEMDNAIESIYQIIKNQDQKRKEMDEQSKGTLLIVCGDHGMNEKGNHGGSSAGETSAALVFLSPSFEEQPVKAILDLERSTEFGYPVIDQIDVVPTLATLFSFPIPKNNIGKLILDLYHDDLSNILRHLERNAQQLGQLLINLVPEFSKAFKEPFEYEAADDYGKLYTKAKQLQYQYGATKDEDTGKQSASAYFEFIEAAQRQLANTASDYSLNLMIAGVICICLSAIGFISTMAASEKASLKKKQKTWCSVKFFSIVGLISYAVSMFASSFVEEENETWYFFLQSIILLATCYGAQLSLSSTPGIAVQLFLVRISMAWESISFTPSTGFHLLAFTLLYFVTHSIYYMLYRLQHHHQTVVDVHQTSKIIQRIVKLILSLILVFQSVFVFVYKLRGHPIASEVPTMYTSLLDWELLQQLNQIQLGRLIYNYCGASVLGLCGLFYVLRRSQKMDIITNTDGEEMVEDEQETDDDNADLTGSSEEKSDTTSNFENPIQGLILQLLLYILSPVLILLSDTHSAILFFIFALQFQCLRTWQSLLNVPVWLKSVLIICLCHSAFFLTGHSNSMASVDLSNAYIGIEQYDTVFIGVLTFCSNWSASIWWAVAGWALVMTVTAIHPTTNSTNNLDESNSSSSGKWLSYIQVQCILFGVVLASLSIAVTILREHLFIWTVFSPKYLYQMAWTCLFHWTIQVIIGSLCTQFIFSSV